MMIARSLPDRLVSLAAGSLAAALILLLPASEALATIHVPASQAGVIVKEDNQSSFWEAVDSLNKGKVNAGPALHGCVNDSSGGAAIELEGVGASGAHYKT